MSFIADTHILLWSFFEPHKLIVGVSIVHILAEITEALYE
jgi:hypothetical protein